MTMLFESFSACSMKFNNRVVMAPMTRSRAEGNIPNALMAEYYGQRATAGLIITEGTAPSPNALGYPRIPGLFNQAHAQGWRLVTDAVHAKGGKIFVQLMHTGRVGNVANLPLGAEVIGPGSALCPGEMYTDAKGMQPMSPPRVMNHSDISQAIGEYAASARLAVDAGFDGVELHGANGYLIEQFLNPLINQRTDEYGRGMEGRSKFALEVSSAVVGAIGAERVGIRLSPYGVFNGTGEFPEIQAQYLALAEKLAALGMLYIHLVDHSSMGAPPVPADFKVKLRNGFKGLFILAGGFNQSTAEEALAEKRGDLVAFGKPFLANPDLVARMQKNSPLNEFDQSTFYTPGSKGYTDYPQL